MVGHQHPQYDVMMHLKWKTYKPWLGIKLFTLEDTLSLFSTVWPPYWHFIML